jgi:2-polyprenyl-3-methyl-5-hydroxy-6-metoxy-1,4-benzoquinol methylase
MKARFFSHGKCDICKSEQKEMISEFGSQNLVRCKGCRLVYFDKQCNNFSDLYDQEYFSKGRNNKANYANYEEMGDKNIIKSNFRFAYDFINSKSESIGRSKKNLLDIGAGYGHFIKYLPNNIIARAVEVSKLACSQIKSAGMKVYQGDFLDIKTGGKYDFITAFDVIEHQIHLRNFIKKVYSSLADGGYFIFTTPDYGSIFNKILKKRAPTIQPNYHNYYFDKPWVIRNFPSFGYRIVSIDTTYFARLTVAQAWLLASFAFPWINKINMLKFAEDIQFGKMVIPCMRLGGIQVIAQKQ